MSNHSAADRLDRTLTAMEDLVLSASDCDLSVADDEADATLAFIAAKLASRHALTKPLPNSRRSSRTIAVRQAIPRDAAGRRRLLGRLMATRPELPARISMAFKSREPEDAEIAEMLDDLLRGEDDMGVA
ncbi:hypothetical protein [Novosphingobium sp. FKTRR1]|uniref:hypothetical protein n=1 Tax=Novosphingobium sp. FKTRR1 TaxID=2879118 RepID=UPI001CF05B35|nr:hypothetical protein [Novosphingobium sp. FKTRR1]MCB2075413.1 hypothetical protein [Novosphingobium sp.]